MSPGLKPQFLAGRDQLRPPPVRVEVKSDDGVAFARKLTANTTPTQPSAPVISQRSLDISFPIGVADRRSVRLARRSPRPRRQLVRQPASAAQTRAGRRRLVERNAALRAVGTWGVGRSGPVAPAVARIRIRRARPRATVPVEHEPDDGHNEHD